MRAGFVLLEAVVALAIISLIAIALLATTATQVRTADKAALLLTARSLAEERMAAVRMLSYDELRALPDSLAAGRFPEPFQDYTWRAEVAPVDDEYDLFAVAVAVDVFDESFVLRTLVHEPQPQIQTGTRAMAPAINFRNVPVNFPDAPQVPRR